MLEGKFHSAYKNRIKPFKLEGILNENIEKNKMIVIADGDIINYNYANKKPIIGGVDKWTKQQYGNKNFLLNSMHYLLDENGLINIRDKKISIAFLNKEKIHRDKIFWRSINIVLPIALTLFIGSIFMYWRKKKYSA